MRRVSQALERRAKPEQATEPPAFTLAARDGGLPSAESFPCSDCHGAEDEVNATVRALQDEHADVKLAHGGGRIWCLDCHHARERDALLGEKGAAVPASEPHRACGRCHADVMRDFLFGAHGKRDSGWKAERIVLSCLACHGAHDPSIAPRRPASPPTPRADLPAPRDVVLPHGRLHRALSGGGHE
jgi:hypothetical protein